MHELQRSLPFPHAIKFFCRKNPFIEARRLAIRAYILTWSFLAKLTKQNADNIHETMSCINRRMIL